MTVGEHLRPRRVLEETEKNVEVTASVDIGHLLNHLSRDVHLERDASTVANATADVREWKEFLEFRAVLNFTNYNRNPLNPTIRESWKGSSTGRTSPGRSVRSSVLTRRMAYGVGRSDVPLIFGGGCCERVGNDILLERIVADTCQRE